MPAARIVERVFRTAPEFDIVPFERLGEARCEKLRSSVADADLYAIVVSQRSAKLKAVSRDLALLLEERRTPGSLKHLADATDSDALNTALATMVLDGLLELEHEGQFLSGPAACDAVIEHQPTPEARTQTAQLSKHALRYAQTLATGDVGQISAWLYSYNRLPYSGRWAASLQSASSIAAFLRLDECALLARSRGFELDQANASANWFIWRSPACSIRAGGWKLYISSRPKEMPEVFRVVLEQLEALDVHAFKVASHPAGLLRPDKFVLYPASLSALQNIASRLAQKLSGCEAHGVPFSAASTEDGLLSWGLDPQPGSVSTDPSRPISWRAWITDQLAAHLVAGMAQPARGMEPWQFAARRLSLSGVDVNTWEPGPTCFAASRLGVN